MKHELIFWFDQPPKVGKGCFNYISEKWDGTVVYAYMHGYSSTRKKTHWDDSDFGKAVLVDLHDNPAERAEEIFNNYPNALHVFDGFKSDVFKIIKYYVLADKAQFICFSERPGIYGKWWKRLIKRIYIPVSEIYIQKRYSKHVRAYLPLGMTGVRTNLKFGWNKEKLYPFMYDPVDYTEKHDINPINQPMKFVYVGRFSRYTKGTDVLIKAADCIERNSDQYTMTFVGGYGDMKDEIIEWTNRKSNCCFGGTWDSIEVGKKLKDYDVCIVPSKFDGWNLLVNEATRAHIGIIVSNQAVSDEIVEASKAGIVYQADSYIELKQAIEFAIDHPDEVLKWKMLAREYANRISSQSVGEYLMNIIKFECLNMGSRPICPWISEKNRI